MREKLFWILKKYGVSDHIAKAFLEIPREEFLTKSYPLSYVYEDIVLVSYDDGEEYSTSSQPSLMALFMEWVGLDKGMRVLEIGGGTGYNAAVMSRVVGEKGLVVSVEYSRKICEIAKRNVERLGIENVIFVCGDGYYGVPEFSPYDVIFVTVGVDEVPETWFTQLKEGGRVIVPINLKLSRRQPAFLFKKGSVSCGKLQTGNQVHNGRGQSRKSSREEQKAFERISIQQRDLTRTFSYLRGAGGSPHQETHRD